MLENATEQSEVYVKLKTTLQNLLSRTEPTEGTNSWEQT